MKILIASDTYYPTVNGAAYFTYRLSTELSKRGHKVYVIAPSESFTNTLETLDGVKVYGVRSLPVLFYEKFRVSPIFLIKNEVDKIIEKISPDVIHIQNHINIGRAVLMSGKRRNIPVVGTNHFMPENLVHYLHLPKKAENKIAQVAWKDFSKVYGQLDYVTSPTKTAAELLQDIGFDKNVAAVSCGIDRERFNPKNNGDYLFKKYNISNKKPVMLYVGRLDKDKNVDVIIKSLPKILKSVDTQLVIGGVGKLRKPLEKLAENLGVSEKVKFLGFVSDADLPNIYRIADVFVTTGGAELQCLSALEAVSSGVPVVAADAVAVPELVHDGVNGYLFPLNSTKGLSKGVVKILKNKKLARKMGGQSLAISKDHDIEKTISTFEKIYKDVISKNKNKPYRFENANNIFPKFIVKSLFVIIVLAVLLRIGMSSPNSTLAKSSEIKDRIMNLEIVKRIENLDNKLKLYKSPSQTVFP